MLPLRARVEATGVEGFGVTLAAAAAVGRWSGRLMTEAPVAAR